MKKRKWLLLIATLIAVLSLPVTANAAVKLNKKKASIYVRQTLQLNVTGTKKKVKWSTSNKKIATVNQKGKVTGRKVGKAIITATVSKKTLRCEVSVSKAGETFPSGVKNMGDGHVEIYTPGGSSENGNKPTIYLNKIDMISGLDIDIYDVATDTPCWIYVDGKKRSVQSVGFKLQLGLSIDGNEIKSGTHRVDVVQFRNANPLSEVIMHRVRYYKIVKM